MENQPNQPPIQNYEATVEKTFGMHYGPAVPGLELLGEGNNHLLSENITVQRTGSDGQPGPTEAGWRLNGVFQDESGQLKAHVQKPFPAESSPEGKPYADLSKVVSLESILAVNPAPENNVDTTPRNKLLEGSQEDETNLEQLGEPAVKDNIEVDSVSEQPDNQVGEEVQEPKIPNVQEIFSSSSNLIATLKDPEVPTEIKQSIRGVVNTWKEVEKLEASSELWDTVVEPSIKRMSQAAGQSEYVVSDITSQAEQMQANLRQIANAVYDGDGGSIADAVRRANLGERVDEFSASLKRRLPSMEDTSSASMRMLLETEDADYQRKKLARADDREVTTDEADRILERLAEVIPGAASFEALGKASSEEAEQIEKRFPNWRNRYDIVNEAITFARRGAGLEPANTLRTLNELEMIVDNSRRGRYDGDQIEYARRSLDPLLEDLDTVRRFMRTAQTYSREIV